MAKTSGGTRNYSGNNTLLFVIYGGGKPCKEFAQRNQCVYVEQVVNVKNKLKSLEHRLAQIEGTIAFNNDSDTKQIAQNSIKQVYDFSVQKPLLQQNTSQS